MLTKHERPIAEMKKKKNSLRERERERVVFSDMRERERDMRESVFVVWSDVKMYRHGLKYEQKELYGWKKQCRYSYCITIIPVKAYSIRN